MIKLINLLKEYTKYNFRPEISKTPNKSWFIKYFPASARTVVSAEEQLLRWEGEDLLVHVQYMEVVSKINPSLELGVRQQQYWNPRVVPRKLRTPEDIASTEANITEVQIKDENSGKNIISTTVDTKVFLKELTTKFEVIKTVQ